MFGGVVMSASGVGSQTKSMGKAWKGYSRGMHARKDEK